MKKLIILIILFIISSMYIVAVPPFSQTGTGDSGLDIGIPINSLIQTNKQYIPHFHVYNVSNGYNFREGDQINCTLHIYSFVGKHIYKNWTNTFDDIFDFEFVLPKTLFNTSGEYPYLIQCEQNITQVGGYLSSLFRATETGEEKVTTNVYIAIIFVLLCVVCMFVLLAEKLKILYLDMKEDITKNYLPFILYILISWLMIPLLGVVIKYNQNQGAGLTSTLNGVYTGVMAILVVLTSLWAIGFLLWILNWMGGLMK